MVQAFIWHPSDYDSTWSDYIKSSKVREKFTLWLRDYNNKKKDVIIVGC